MIASKPIANCKQLIPDGDPHAMAMRSQCDRIQALAADGLKVRDISEIVGVHPILVARIVCNAEPLPKRFETVSANPREPWRIFANPSTTKAVPEQDQGASCSLRASSLR